MPPYGERILALMFDFLLMTSTSKVERWCNESGFLCLCSIESSELDWDRCNVDDGGGGGDDKLSDPSGRQAVRTEGLETECERDCPLMRFRLLRPTDRGENNESSCQSGARQRGDGALSVGLCRYCPVSWSKSK